MSPVEKMNRQFAKQEIHMANKNKEIALASIGQWLELRTTL